MEFLDIVNENDVVVGVASRNEAYEKLLLHRIVNVIIFNDKNEMALQLRSSSVSFCPNHWSTSVGGHVQTGETYEIAALREYEEELGAQSKLEFVGKDLYEVPGNPKKFLATFRSKFNGLFIPDSKVVDEVSFFSLEKIKEMIENGEKFHPELIFLLEKYWF